MEHAQHREHPRYFRIFWWLLGLTIIEIAAALPHYNQTIKAILLIGLASSKASFVALYFMHLKFEKRTLTIIALTPLILCVFLVLMLLPDLMAEARHAAQMATSAAHAGAGH
jgi:caa(3)-type oxidase subunit IV